MINYMIYYVLFLILFLCQSINIDALYLSRAKLATQRFSKKYVSKNISRLKKRFFYYLFSPKIKRILYKKPQILKNIMIYGKKGTLRKKSLNLKVSIKRYYQESGNYAKVNRALSFQYARKKSLEELEMFFEDIIKHKEIKIKNMNFAMQEVTKTLEREQKAQEQKKFVAYHVMPAEIFLVLNVYTKIYDKLHNQMTPKNFMYLRTFNDITPEKLKNFLELQFFSTLAAEERKYGKEFLLSLSPFLFQSKMEESVLGRTLPSETGKSMAGIILADAIADLFNIDPFKASNKAYDSLRKFDYSNFIDKNVIFQLVFEGSKRPSGLFSKSPIEIKFRGVSSKDIHVEYDKNHTFPNLYWSGEFGTPCTRSDDPYNGPEMFQKMLKGEDDPAAPFAQVRLFITPEYLKEKKYEIRIVDIDNDFQNFDQKVNELIELILKEVEK